MPAEDFLPDVDATAPLPSAGPADYTQDAQNVVQQEQQPLAISLFAASKLDPDRHAKVLQVAEATGLNSDVVDRNFEYLNGVQKYNDQTQAADFATIFRERPRLAKWLQDRDNATIGQDDLPALKDLHDRLEALNPPPAADNREALPWMSGVVGANARRAILRPYQMVMAIPALMQQMGRSVTGNTEEPGVNSPLGAIYSAEDLMRSEERAANTYQTSVGKKVVGATVGMAASPLNLVLPIAGGMAAARSLQSIAEVTKAATALRGASLTMGVQGAVTGLGEPLREKQREGGGTGIDAADLGNMVGQASLSYLLGKTGGLIGPLRALREVQPGVGETMGDIVRNAVISGTQSAGAGVIHQAMTGQGVRSAGDVAMDYLLGAVPGAAVAAAGMPSAFARSASAKLSNQALDAHAAQEGARQIAGAAVALRNSKTLPRSEDRTSALMQAIIDASGQEQSGKLYFQAEEWDNHWRAAGEDPAKMAFELTGDPDAYAQSMATGGQLEIGQPAFLSKFSTRDDFAQLLTKAALGPDKPTLEQANEFFKNSGDAIKKLQEQIASEVQAGTGSLDEHGQLIFEDVKAKLIEAGQDSAAAEQSAKIHQSFWTTIADRFNADRAEGQPKVNANDLYQAINLRIQRSLPDIVNHPDVQQTLEPLLNQLRAAKESPDRPVDVGMLPPHLAQLKRALDNLHINLEEHPTNESVFARVREELQTNAEIEAKRQQDGGKVESFKTEKGSHYTVTSDGRTQRTKSDHSKEGHDPKDVGLKEHSDRTYYVSKEAAEEVGRQQGVMGDKGKGVIVRDGRAYIVQWNEKAGKWGATKDEMSGHEISDSPAVGKYPLELWKSKSGRTGGDQGELFTGTHPGNKITEVSLSGGKAEVTLSQPVILDAPKNESLHFMDLMKQWKKAHGDRTPTADDWQTLVEQSAAVDEENGRSFQQKARANITFGNLNTTIRLFQEANLSSFLHESGHLFLESFGQLAERADAPEQFKKDYHKALEWLGVNQRSEIQEHHHEKFARGFEQYLMSGKAPSVGLRNVFATIKGWMVHIYQKLSALNVKLSPEMTDVFDRLLASDEQIRQAAEVNAADPLFSSAAQAGMSEAEFAAYQKRALTARQDSRDKLEREYLSAYSKAHSEQYATERERVMGEVKTSLNDRPEMSAVSVLQRNRLPDGTQLPGPAIKLDRAELVKIYGEDSLSFLPGAGKGRKNQRNRGPMVYTKEDGVPLDAAAESLGFRSGDELWQALINAPDARLEAERLIDSRMRELHPDPMLTGEGSKLAVETLNSDKLADVLDEEAQTLARLAKQSAQPRQLMKVYAENAISRMKPKDINPEIYRSAGAKAGREAFKQLTKGNFEGALIQRQKQQQNLELHRAAEAAIAKAQKIRDYMSEMSKGPAQERIGKAGGWEWTVTREDGSAKTFPSVEQAKAALAENPGATYARTSSYVDQINSILNEVEWGNVSGKRLADRESRKAFILQQEAMGNPILLPPELINDSQLKNWRTMAVGELSAVYDAVKNIEHTARTHNKELAQQRKESLDEIKAKVGANIVEHSKGPKEQLYGVGSFAKLKDTVGTFVNANFRVPDLIRRMNGHKDGGELFFAWQHPLNEAKTREVDAISAATRHQDELLNKWGKLGTNNINAPKLSWREHIPAINTSLNKWGQIMVALNWGNVGNRERLMEGHHWDEKQVNAVLDRLDSKDWELVRGIWKHIDSYWSDIAALEQRVHGIAPAKVEAMPFMTKHGEQPGGYFPIKYDNRLSPAPAHETPESEVEGMLAGKGYGMASTDRGHTEARTGSQGRPLDLSFGVIEGHLKRVIHDLNQREVIIDLNRLLRSKEFTETMVSHWGKGAWNQFDAQLRETARAERVGETGMERILEWGRSGTNASRMAFNIAGTVMDVAGLPNAIPRLGLSNWLKAIPDAFNPMMHKWAEEQSASLRQRGELRLKSLGEVTARTGVLAPLLSIQHMAYWMRSKAWKLLDTHAWIAGYYKAMKETGRDEAKSIAIADQLVNDTQGGQHGKDLPQILRGGPLAKLFTNQMSFANANFNMMAQSVQRFCDQRYSPGAAIQMASDMMVYLCVAPAIYMAARQFLSGEDMSAWQDPNELRKKLGSEAAYTVLSGIPLLREAAGPIQQGNRYEGPAGLSFLGNAIHIATSASREMTAAEGEGKGMDKATARAMALTAGTIFHFPAAQVLKSINGFQDADAKGENPIFGSLFGASRKK